MPSRVVVLEAKLDEVVVNAPDISVAIWAELETVLDGSIAETSPAVTVPIVTMLECPATGEYIELMFVPLSK